MSDQKIENLLNLALNATQSERERSLNLNVGFDEETNTWDIIVKYSGDISRISSEAISVVELMNEYAILTVREDAIEALANIPEIEYIEKPKRLYFAINNAKAASCINSLQVGNDALLGEGCIVSIIDSGIDYSHEDFRNEDGTTRILNLWDQTITGNPPNGYIIGTEYTMEKINEALSLQSRQEQLNAVPSRDLSGHGTAVAGIAASNGRASNGVYRGVAPRAELIIVKLGTPRADSFPRTTELMQAVDYVIKKALEYQKPVAVNLSFGNTYGSHDGNSLLETYIDSMANIWKNVICIGTGNEGATGGHTSGVVENGVNTKVEIAVAEYETVLNLQIWKNYADAFNIIITSPGGRSVGPVSPVLEPQRFVLEGTELLLYYGDPSPYNISQEIYIDFIPSDTYVTSGIWTITLVPERIVSGEYNMWLPSQSALNQGTNFLFPTETTTLTIPSTASRAISVGAYDSNILSYADFSGRGNFLNQNVIKPTIAAPGVNITTTAQGGGYAVRTGTSMATPFVTGSAAIMMEWGIVRGNDAFLYGEKLKAYLQRGAKALPGFTEFPNPQVGWGALCVRDSLPF